MAAFSRWTLIILGTMAGVFTPWQHQAVVLTVLLMGYAACYSLKFKGFQLVIAYLYGGLATGLGLQFLIGFGIKNAVIQMIVAPLLIWLVLRIFFYALETNYSLQPKPEPALPNIAPGHSAWSGDTTGQADKPDADGRYIRYEFFGSGELCMGGPTYGEVIFNNRVALSGVGPSIVLSDDGRYAVMTLPSRSQWGLWLVDLTEKCIYQPDNQNFWEIDQISNDVIYGRCSPLTSNETRSLPISKAIAESTKLPLVEDDGWWVLDYPGRAPLPNFKAVAIASQLNQHRVTFVPDLKPFKQNPFLRYQSPVYSVLIDDELLELETTSPTAVWINGKQQPGRFLVISGQIIDFMANETAEFNIQNRASIHIKACDEHTHLTFSNYIDASNGYLLAHAKVMPRSVGWSDPEYEVYSWTSPFDEEEASYWDANGKVVTQARSRIERYVDYTIDLANYFACQQIRQCVNIQLVNRSPSGHKANLVFAGAAVGNRYAAYTCTTSCGLVIENVLHEAIWSHCGRYLAIVYFESPPLVPHRIAIIDFAAATIQQLKGSFALPSFIWFDANLVQFSHVVGLQESISYGPGKSETLMLRITDKQYADDPYDLLISSVANRRKQLEEKAQANCKSEGYASGSVQEVAQHCVLFAPDFNDPVLQPYVKNS